MHSYRIPDDCMDEKRYPLFMARAVLPGFLHMDVKSLPQMQDEAKRRYLFAAIDRATRWVFVAIKAIKANKTAASAKAFLNALHKACPIKITSCWPTTARSSPIACLHPASASPMASMSLISCVRFWE